MDVKIGIPRPSLRRLPLYYRRLKQALADGKATVSSEELARSAGASAAQVRKDLSYLQEYGRAGIGYDAQSLASYLEEYLGLINDKEAVIVGAGNLGRALALYPGFAAYGLQILALFDSDPAKVGQMVGDREVLPIEKLPSLTRRLNVEMGIVAVPMEAAQGVVNTMISAGIKVIWNFAPCCPTVPPDVVLKNEDLAAELATLSHHITQRKLSARRRTQGASP